jgi:hypothetical protein
MADQYGFVTLDARQDPHSIQRQLRRAVGNYLQGGLEQQRMRSHSPHIVGGT